MTQIFWKVGQGFQGHVREKREERKKTSHQPNQTSYVSTHHTIEKRMTCCSQCRCGSRILVTLRTITHHLNGTGAHHAWHVHALKAFSLMINNNWKLPKNSKITKKNQKMIKTPLRLTFYFLDSKGNPNILLF